MPTPARKPTHPDNLMLVVGQLLEATKAASEGLKSLSQEVQGSAKAIIAMAKTVEVLEDKVAEIEKIVHDSTHSGNLVNLATLHGKDIESLRLAVDSMRATLTTLGVTQHRSSSTRQTLLVVGQIAAWTVATGIALYGALANGGK